MRNCFTFVKFSWSRLCLLRTVKGLKYKTTNVSDARFYRDEIQKDFETENWNNIRRSFFFSNNKHHRERKQNNRSSIRKNITILRSKSQKAALDKH